MTPTNQQEFMPPPRLTWRHYLLGCGWAPLIVLLTLAGIGAVAYFGLAAVRRGSMADKLEARYGGVSLLPGAQLKQVEAESQVRLFFVSQDGGLVAQTRTLHRAGSGMERAHVIARELNKPSASPTFQRPLPEGVNIRAVYLEEGVLLVDLSAELLQVAEASPMRERLMIYSIVNSLMLNDETQSFQGVRFMIDGRLRDAAWGWLDLSAPLGPDLSLTR